MRMMTQRHSLLLVAIAALAVVTFGCGDQPDDQEADNQSEQQQSNDDNDDNQVTEEDCEDDEYWHPVNGECRLDDDNDNDGEDDEDNGEDDNDGPDVNDGEDDNDDEQLCGEGSIEGQSCRPDGDVLPGAQVSVSGEDCDGQSFEETTTADNEGFYSFGDVPAGDHELSITSGSFNITDSVTIYPDEKTDLTAEDVKLCLQGAEADIAVFEGSFDDVGQLLDSMDVEYDSYSGGFNLGSEGTDLILDQDALLEYDILFIECQVDKPSGADQDIAMANLRRFVREGNSAYASDRAHPWIYLAIPDAIPFELDYDDDSDDIRNQIQTTSPGGSTGTYTADVISDEMLTLLGQSTVDFHFDTGNWSIVSEDTGTSSTAHFSQQETGSSFENASPVTTYDDPIGDGRIIYTSFHNSEQDQLDDTMEEILEYMIFQL